MSFFINPKSWKIEETDRQIVDHQDQSIGCYSEGCEKIARLMSSSPVIYGLLGRLEHLLMKYLIGSIDMLEADLVLEEAKQHIDEYSSVQGDHQWQQEGVNRGMTINGTENYSKPKRF